MIYADSRFFKLSELACPCCESVRVDSELLAKLDELRERMARPLRVTSGYRCEQHNAKVGGKRNSQHREGKAADIAALSPRDFDSLQTEAEAVGFGGIGVYPHRLFVHVDVRPGRARWEG